MSPPAGNPQAKARLLGLALVLALMGCEPGRAPLEPPRIEDERGLDPLVLERVHEGLAACERGDEGAWLELAMIYEANDLDLLALRTYAACLELGEGTAGPLTAGAPLAELHFHRGRALAKLGQSDEAMQAFSAALEREPDYVPTLWRRGDLALDSGRVAEARADFERALALEPNDVSASLGLARVQLIEEDPAGVLATLTPVSERQPKERFVHALLARAQRALGNEVRAAQELALEEQADEISPLDARSAAVRRFATGVIAAVRRANGALVKDKPAEALKVLEPLYERLPEELAVLQMLGKALVMAGENERALAVLAQARKVHADDYKLELYTGLAWLGQDLPSPARTHLEAARTLNPAYGPTHAALGELENRLGHLAAAEEAFARALAGQEVDLRSYHSLGQVQMRQSAWERACATYQMACERYPQSAAPWVHLAEAQLQRGSLGAAQAALTEAKTRNPSFARIVEVQKLLDAQTGAQ